MVSALKSALNALNDGIVILNESGDVIFANKIGEMLNSQGKFESESDEPVKYGDEYYEFSRRKLNQGQLLYWRNVTLHQQLKELMVIDPETGVYNAKFMRDTIERELDRVNREGSQMALALIDVDPGDDGPSMADIAQVLLRTVRNFDLVCRGDRSDFVLMLFVVDPDRLEETGRRIFNAIKQLGAARVSIGLTLSGRAPSHESMMKQAQRALYVVNTRGGNDISIY